MKPWYLLLLPPFTLQVLLSKLRLYFPCCCSCCHCCSCGGGDGVGGRLWPLSVGFGSACRLPIPFLISFSFSWRCIDVTSTSNKQYHSPSRPLDFLLNNQESRGLSHLIDRNWQGTCSVRHRFELRGRKLSEYREVRSLEGRNVVSIDQIISSPSSLRRFTTTHATHRRQWRSSWSVNDAWHAQFICKRRRCMVVEACEHCEWSRVVEGSFQSAYLDV